MTSQRTRRECFVLAAVLAVSLVLVSSAAKCGEKPPPRRTLAEIELDNEVNAKVRDNLTASPEVRATDIDISTFALKVTLDGKVRSENERNRAIQITRDTEVIKDGTTHKVKEVEAKDLTVSLDRGDRGADHRVQG